MLAAVTQEAAGYEGLRNYIAGGGAGGARRPTAVAAFDASARQEAGLPGTALPGAPTPIPTSSAQPGKQTNQRIPYARLVTKFPFPATGGFDPDGIYEGDLVFVHRYDGMNTGYDTNKPTRMATLAQINAVLRTYNFPAVAAPRKDAPLPQNADAGYLIMLPSHTETEYTVPGYTVVTEGFDDVVVPPKVVPAGTVVLHHPMGVPEPEPPVAAYSQPGGRPDWKDPDDWINRPGNEAARVEARAAWVDYDDDAAKYAADPPKWRWQHCPFLAEWTPDGVCCGSEHEHREDRMVGSASSNPGELFNIAISGPTMVRNAAEHKFNANCPEQHIDDGVRTLDKLFIGLICYEQRDESGDVTHYMYQYKAFSSRQIAWATFQRTVGDAATPYTSYSSNDSLVPGGSNQVGPTVGDFQRMCCVWRMGSVLDTRSGMMPYKCATINVVVEEWSLRLMREEYNRFFGESLYLGLVRNAASATLIADAAALLYVDATRTGVTSLVKTLRNTHEALQTWMREDGIDLAHVAADVRAWRAVDREWEDERDLRVMRWMTADEGPAQGNPAGGPALPTRRGRFGEFVTRPTTVRPRLSDVEAARRVAEGTALPPDARDPTNDPTGFYDPPSPSSSSLNARADETPASRELRAKIVRLYQSQLSDLRTIGRTAALFDEEGYSGDDLVAIQLADEVHTHWMGVRGAAAFWSSSFQAQEGGWNWPL